MYKYSKGINLVAGGEKHRVYVKKSSNGKGAKGHVMVNHPTTDKGKWDTIDLTEKAGAKTVEQGKAATRKWHRENPYTNGTKNIKKYQEGESELSLSKKYSNKINPDDWEKFSKFNKSLPSNLRDDNFKYGDRNKYDLYGMWNTVGKPKSFNDVKDKEYFPLQEDGTYHGFSVGNDDIWLKPKTHQSAWMEYSSGALSPDLKDMTVVQREDGRLQYVPKKNNTKFLSGAKSVKQYRGDENLPEAKNGMKNCGCKHPKKKYKYGTGAVVIPEGSAIVTANGGKNKQALRAYKQGNYKLLNRIIDGMPEDRVDKAQKGKKTTPAKEQWTGGNQKFSYTAQTPGRLDYQPDRFGNPIWSQANYPTWKQKVSEGIQDSERYKKILNYLKNYAGADNEDVRKILAEQDPDKLKDKILKLGTDEKVGPFHVALEQAFNETEEIPEDIPEDIPGDTPGKQTITEIPEKKPISPYKYKPNFNNFPSLAEVAARSSVLGQGVEGVPENYLKLDRYNYASQLPKTLREIQLAEQGGRETARDMVAGDAGRYLAQSGNLSAARMKASNDAVIQDTLARQDILNKNVDLGNLEAQTNTGLKNEYAMQRAANRGAFNNQLISLGQSIDTAADTSKVMGAQMKNDAQRLEMLKSMAESGNYNVVTNPDGTIRYEAAKKGFKKVKTYKRR